MAREAPIAWRPPKALRDRIEAAASAQGMSLAKVIEDLVERGLSITDGASVKKAGAKAKATTGKVRTVLCVHRRTPEQFCARCD